jgi:hypothetical protein
VVQAAALAGVGLLFQGSGHRYALPAGQARGWETGVSLAGSPAHNSHAKRSWLAGTHSARMSLHRLMAEAMLEEIGRRPGAASRSTAGSQLAAGGLCEVRPCPPLLRRPRNIYGSASATLFTWLHTQGVAQDREGYALAAGWALGLITLGRGRGAPGLADLRLEERLR